MSVLGDRLGARSVAVVMTVVLCAVAFWHCARSISGISWSPLFDPWRDAGMAQTILDGHYPADILYRDETLWYNPLTGAVVALVSWITGLRPAVTVARIGLYCNLLLPLAFAALAARLAGRWATVVALAFLLFGNPLQRGTVQSWSPWMFNLATYSPWLWAPHFSQGFLYLTLLAYLRTLHRPTYRGHVLTGFLLGVTFMTHTAPALIFGGIASLMTVGRLIAAGTGDARSRRRVDMAAGFVLLLGAALVTSLPYTYSIFWNYHFRMQNVGPSFYADPYLNPSVLASFFRDRVTFSNALAVAGFVAMMRLPERRTEKALICCWIAVAGGLWIHCYLCRYIPALGHPFTPPHHYLISLSAVKTLLFGCGVVWLSEAATRSVARWRAWRAGAAADADSRDAFRARFAPVAAALVFLVLYPFYFKVDDAWKELSRTRDRAAYEAEFKDIRATYAWMLDNTDSSDVFVCDEVLACQIVMPAARKVVATMGIFANPYLADWPRAADCARMLEAFKKGDEAAFRALGRKYDAQYVLVRDSERERHATPAFAQEVFRSGSVAVYRVIG